MWRSRRRRVARARPLVGWVAAASRVPARRHVLRHCRQAAAAQPRIAKLQRLNLLLV